LQLKALEKEQTKHKIIIEDILKISAEKWNRKQYQTSAANELCFESIN
jgi:hypothetical protein